MMKPLAKAGRSFSLDTDSSFQGTSKNIGRRSVKKGAVLHTIQRRKDELPKQAVPFSHQLHVVRGDDSSKKREISSKFSSGRANVCGKRQKDMRFGRSPWRGLSAETAGPGLGWMALFAIDRKRPAVDTAAGGGHGVGVS
jgi:hypothetical protein